MIRLDLHPRLRRRVSKLTANQVASVEAALEQLKHGFGQPHLHSGLGIRRLRRGLHECRAGLELRIIFWVEPGALTAFDVMTHAEVRAFLQRF